MPKKSNKSHPSILEAIPFPKVLAIGSAALFLCLLPTAGTGDILSMGEFNMGVENGETILIDDFSNPDVSSYGTRWAFFSDQVMGGVSTGRMTHETIDGKRCLRILGDVSLENRGGFIQGALSLAGTSRAFDAGSYTGVRIMVRGNGEEYAIHLRTLQTERPWQYYGAKFAATPEWTSVDIPFSAFEGENLVAALDTRRLTRIAVVAASKAFNADLAVARLEFY
jgi:hypothetical protein